MHQAEQIDRAQVPSGRRTGRGDQERWWIVVVVQTTRTMSTSGRKATLVTISLQPSPDWKGTSGGRERGRPSAAQEVRLVSTSRQDGPEPPLDAPSPVTVHPHLSIVPSRECQPLIEPLTRREAEVLEQLALAESNAEIAAHLQISVRTVESHLSTIYGKLGVQGRLEALRYALQGGMIGEQKQRREDGRRA